MIFWSDLDPFAGSFCCVIWYFNRSLKICSVFTKQIRRFLEISFFQTYCDLHISWYKQYISSTFGHILKEPLLVQKQTILHMKTPILSFLELEGQGRGIIMGMPCLIPVKILLSGEKSVWHPHDDSTPYPVH
jgi:hypothetical protein